LAVGRRECRIDDHGCDNRYRVPIYEYRCERGHHFEVIQSMSDDPIAACQECGAPVERVFHPVAVHFKGSGFYTTDYGSKSKADAGASSDGGDSKSGETSQKSSERKAEAKASSASSD
jgi:putative FmdB family regulatory protein